MDRNVRPRCAFTGDLEHAEQLATEAVELGRLAGRPDDSIIGSFGALLFQIRGAQGRFGELIPLLEARIVASPDVPTWRLALSGALMESDRVDGMPGAYLWLADDGCANGPADVEVQACRWGLGLWSCAVRPAESILRDVYERFTPWAGNFSWTGPTIMHPSDHGLAMVAAVAAARCRRPPFRRCGRAVRASRSASIWRTLYDWAHVLADRGGTARARVTNTAEIALCSALRSA